MTNAAVSALRAIVLALVAACAAGCGQQGPLVLPESARPIDRAEPPPNAAESRDEEDQDER
jgi:predicted small lipoprotein YifL